MALASLDGAVCDAAGATIPVTDEGLLRGDGVFEVMRLYGGRRILLIEAQADPAPSISLGFVEFAPVRVLDGVKSLSYAANMLATRLAKEGGFDEALLVTPHGRVLEAPTSSFFYVLDGELFTPPLDDHILASITRRHVIELTGARERITPRDDARRMTEAFLASTTREVQAVHAIEDHELERGGPVTREAAAALRERIAQETGT